MIDGYIKRADALELAVYQSMMGLNMAQSKLREMPGEDVRPVVHGHWEDVVVAGSKETLCSACGNSGFHFFYYCPHCGAIMDEKEGEA